MATATDNTAANNPEDTAPAPKPDSVGMILARARRQCGEDLPSIAGTLKIRRVLLEALENDAHDQLPGGIYTIGFVRSYANYLKLDASALEAQWRREAEALTQRPEYSFPTPTLERRLPGFTSIILGLIILAIPIGAAVYYVDQAPELIIDIPELPEHLQAYVPNYPAPEIDLPSATPAEVLATPLDATGAPEIETAPESTLTDTTPQPGVSDTRIAQSFGADAADARFTLIATRDVWVQVRDTSTDQIILTRVLRADDTYNVPDRDGLLMTLGDAGAVRTVFPEGLEVVPGNDGAVVRDIPLNRDGILDMSR